MLRVNEIDVAYGDVKVLHRVSLSVEEGEIVALVGANAAGKTTTLNTISGILRPRAGTIEFRGKRIDHVPAYEVVGLGLVHVPEGRRLFPFMTVLENLELGAYTSEARRRKDQTLKMLFDLLPILHERQNQLAGSLSGGEQQRVSIARTLATDPEVLLMDEPTSALDPAARAQIEELVGKMNRVGGLTIVFVTHDMEQARRVGTRTMLLVGGRKIEEATTAEFFANPQTETARLFVEGKLANSH